MPIQILPARLANQIAAGEVVERPASVIKELVENALDAGATRIDIDVDKGGAKTLRIRDNGCGIVKDELTLALSRHATSKVNSFDDLENITSLGFRGEALASISSVSRLTLTSKPADQAEAWQAYAEGRDMAVKIVPAAHPDGTTIEVVDLFFNTPARRKFLRTEKTEFYHIDELVKRIALSRFDVQFVLKHNGKAVRQLRTCVTDEQKDRRVGQICGRPFIESALRVSCEHGGILLTGWISEPRFCRGQNDVQFSYVNGRMMRDKLINHAIRQAYGQRLGEGMHPGYVLYLDMDPRQMDVNVHPAKHEVRFHQARLVHDFIVQALENALLNELPVLEPVAEAQYFVREPEPQSSLYPGHQKHSPAMLKPAHSMPDDAPVSANSNAGGDGAYSAPYQRQPYQNQQPSQTQLRSYHNALAAFSEPVDVEPQSPSIHQAPVAELPVFMQPVQEEVVETTERQGSCLGLFEARYALYRLDDTLHLLSLDRIYSEVMARQNAGGLIAQPLLLPVKIALDTTSLDWLASEQERMADLGIDYECLNKAVVVRKVPALMRYQDINDCFARLLDKLQTEDWNHEQTLRWMFASFGRTESYDLTAATQLISRLLQYRDESTMLAQFAKSVSLAGAIEQFDKENTH